MSSIIRHKNSVTLCDWESGNIPRSCTCLCAFIEKKKSVKSQKSSLADKPMAQTTMMVNRSSPV